MASASARRAWNDAMLKATVGAALPPALLTQKNKRRSDRHRKQDRRSKARKVFHNSSDDTDEFRIAVWVDALEGVDPAAAAAEDDDEYDELGDLEADGNNKSRRANSNKASGKSKSTSGSRKKGQQKGGSMPKVFLPRSLGSILVEEANRDDGVTRSFLAAEARILPDEMMFPRRKFCPVHGSFAIYTEPKSGVPYASMRALEQIRERAPPWLTLGGAAAYHEAVKSIRDE